MDNSVWAGIIRGWLRHILGIVGAYLVSKSYIDEQTHNDLLSKGTEQILGIVLGLIAVGWSSKSQIWEWVKLKVARDAQPNASMNAIQTNAKALPVGDKISIAFAPANEKVAPQVASPIPPGGVR